MNIMQIVSRLDSSDRADDAISYARFLTLNGHKAVIVSPRSERVKEIDEFGGRHYALSLRANIFLMPFSVLRLRRVVVKENIGLVHARDARSSFVSFLTIKYPLFFSSRKNLAHPALVTTVYGRGENTFFGKALFWAERVFAFTEEEKEHLVKSGLAEEDKVSVVPPFIDTTGAFLKAPEKGPFYPKRFTVAAAIPFSEEDMAKNFLKATQIVLKTINNIKVVIADSAPPHAKDSSERLRVLIKRHSLSNFVDILPDEKDISSVSGFDIFIQMHKEKTEKSPYVSDAGLAARRVLRFQANGIPVIAAGAGCMKDYAEDNKTALFCRDTPEDIAFKINILYKDRKLRDDIKHAAKDSVAARFGIKTAMESALFVYKEAIDAFNILIIKIGSLGDVILVTPSLKALRKKFPKAKIKVLVGKENKDVLANSPYVDELILCDFKEKSGLGEILDVARKLRRHNFDIVIDFQNSKKSHILSFLSCAPKRFGYDNGKLGFLLNHRIKDALPPIDPVTHQSKILGLLGIYDIDKKLELWPSKEDEEWAENFLASHWVKKDTRLVVLNIDSSPKWVTKLWPAEYYAEVSNRLAKNFGVRVVLIGQDSRNERIKEFLRIVKCKPIIALGKTDIPRLAALVKRCDLLLSSDSAPIHVAASVGTPFLAFFGPTDPKRHLPPAEKYTVFKKDLKCSPCYHSFCDKGYECMSRIKPGEVYDEVLKMLDLKK